VSTRFLAIFALCVVALIAGTCLGLMLVAQRGSRLLHASDSHALVSRDPDRGAVCVWRPDTKLWECHLADYFCLDSADHRRPICGEKP